MSDFPKIMGILNVTPDSFSDGGKYFDRKAAFAHAEQLISEGADLIDVGGESTRPGAGEVPQKEELIRVIPVILSIKDKYPLLPVSVDTTKYEVARQALDAGAEIINDISGLGFNPKLAELASERNAAIIIMHIKGKPRTMQHNPEYKDVVREVYNYLENRIDSAKRSGVKHIIADVGIGFGKNDKHNLELLKNHNKFKGLGTQLLLGISRKSFIGRLLGIENPDERDTPTALLHALLLNSGADIIRVHNVKYLSQLRKLNELLND